MDVWALGVSAVEMAEVCKFSSLFIVCFSKFEIDHQRRLLLNSNV